LTTLLVTNDFPPKIGGIQSYLWELWRRLPPDEVAVLTTPHRDARAFDRRQPFRIERTRAPVLLPTPALGRRVDAVAEGVGARAVVLDPALPLGLLGPHLARPYALVVHGAEVTVVGRLPGTRALLRRALVGADLVVAAGRYPAAEAARAAGRPLPTAVVPPGVDAGGFRPLDDGERAEARAALGLPGAGRLVVSVSRLVPRKGMGTLVRAAALLAPGRPDLTVAISGAGRDRRRLERLVDATGAPVRLLGRVASDALPRLYGCADVFAMLCRNRWGGLEQEGFGIVFVEAAAAGVPSVAGDSGGVRDAVVDGQTGVVVDRPGDPAAAAAALAGVLDDPGRRAALGGAARRRVEAELDYDRIAPRLRAALSRLGR
jgi:phosphatidyl-myo-inositol dimannoside synthase